MDLITESILTEFSKEHEITHLVEDKRFEHLSTYVVTHRRFSGEAFDTEDLVIGDGGDTGIDSIAFLINGALVTDRDALQELCQLSGQLDVTFLFVQAERSSSFDSAKIGGLGYGVLDFFSAQPKLKRNANVAAAAEMASLLIGTFSSKFYPGNPVCRLFYVTTGKWVDEPDLIARQTSVKGDLDGSGLFREVSFECIDAQRLQKYYRETRSAFAREFTFAKHLALPPSPDVVEAYIGYLPWSEFRTIIADEGDEAVNSGLFFDNVRDWLGDDNGVNDEIRATLQSPAKARFALMNNGVTIIVRDLKRTGDKFHIRDYSIVNGCQTSHVLYEARESLDDSVLVPIRLIHTQSEAAINDIIKSTNRQTTVTEEQFFALEEFPKQLEQYFEAFPDAQKKLYYERRHRQYDRLQIEKTRIVTAANMVKAYAAMFLNEPHRTTRSYASLKAKVGTEIFARSHRLEPYYTAALALYKLEFLFRNSKIDAKYKPARFHIILAARILANGWNMPPMSANKMEGYCRVVMQQLWTDPDQLLNRAVDAIALVAGDSLDRDSIRTEAFTQGVISYLRGGT